ncbi:MAG: hypothetical protein WAN47_04990 [Nitrosotalea sp.]
MKKALYLVIVLAFAIGITLGHSTNVIAQQTSIPSWVKNTALWWGQGQISDAEFIKAIQWMINDGLIQISSTTTQSAPAATPPTNPLASSLPTQNEIGSAWQIVGQPTNSRIMGGLGFINSIEQSYTKPGMGAEATVDVGQFATYSDARSAWQQIFEYWNSEHFEKWNLPSNGPNSNTCGGILRTTIQNTAINLVCIGGNNVIEIEVDENGIGAADDMVNFASIFGIS